MKTLALRDEGEETPLQGFRRTEAMMAAVAAGTADRAICRLWSRPAPGLSAGRFHRLPLARAEELVRRHSGGRIVPVGPGVLGCTLVLPSARWLSPDGTELQPQRILNWSLRPLLALLREAGADAFYPGRDVVTVEGAAVAYVSFTIASDGVVIVEHLVSLEDPFSALADRLLRFDPEGACATDPSTFAGAASLATIAAVPARDQWHGRFAERAEPGFSCRVTSVDSPVDSALVTEAASDSAHDAFQLELGPAPAGAARAVARGMLGLVEAVAEVADGRVHDLAISGDLIAPFSTLQKLAEACEGLPLEPSVLRRVVTRVLVGPGDFLFGADDIENLIARIG